MFIFYIMNNKMIKRWLIWILHIEINKYISGDDMDNRLAKRIDDVASLHVKINNLNDPIVG